MLEGMRPGLLDEWLAFETVEPSGQPWLQSAMIAREVATLAGLVQALMGVKDIKWPKVDDFMPGGGKPEKSDKTKENPQEALQRRSAVEQAMFSRAFGSQ